MSQQTNIQEAYCEQCDKETPHEQLETDLWACDDCGVERGVELVDTDRDNERILPTEDLAESRKNDLVAMGADPMNLEIRQINHENGQGATEQTEQERESERGESETDNVIPEFEDRDEPAAAPETVEVMDDSDKTDELHEQNLKQARKRAMPKLSPVEEKVRAVVNQLDHADLNRLVWDPDANAKEVPYNPRNLPYDKPEPSAEAFDLFATILEGELGVVYSVETVDFEQTDELLLCSVEIQKQSEDAQKTLRGFKTRMVGNTTGLDHWRERLYSKARRNALKQDIPPTFVSTLMERYRQVDK